MDEKSKTGNSKINQRDMFVTLIEDMPGMVCRFQPQGIIEFVNQAYCRMLRREREELIGESFYQYIPHEILPKIKAGLDALTPESPVMTIEHPTVIPGGEHRWQRWTNRLLTDEDGRTIAYQAFGQDITEEKLAAQKLQESEKLLRTIAENFPRSYLSVINPDLTIGFTSGQEFKNNQVDPNQYIGMHVRDVLSAFGPKIVEKIVTAYREAFDGRSQSFEQTIGDEVQHYETVPLKDNDGRIEKILVVVQNITERRQAEAALQATEKRYRAIVEDLVELIVRFDVDGTVTYANESYEEFFGPPGDTLVGKNLFEQLPEQVARLVKEKMERLTPEYPAEVDEHPERLPDGRTVWFQWIDRGIFDEDGRLVEIQGVGHDITNRREAEDRIRQSETQLNHIIDTVPEGVILLSADESVVRANPVAKDYLETLAPDWEDGPLARLGDRSLRELLTSPPQGYWHEISSNGRTFEAILKPVENNVANAGWVIVLRDVTEEREIQQRVKRQERLAAVGQLAAGIAHDFNNVMAVIILYVENLLRTVNLPPRARERLHTINRQTQRAADLVQQILDFSRQSILERQNLDLLLFLEEIVELLKRTLPEHIKIELKHGQDSFLIQADSSRIQQMMMNLAVNARDAMPRGGLLLINLSRRHTDETQPMPGRDMPPGDWIQIEVTDTGPGIHPEALAHIFEPFFTTKEIGRGTGLGLAQVYGIVQQHEGYINVTTVEGQGTTFSIYFPAIMPLEELESIPDHSTVRQGQGQKILVVEDNDIIRQALVDTLMMLNYEVEEAANGRYALPILENRAGDFDLVLSDVVMPEMGGVALLHAMREQNMSIPVVFLSGHPLGQELEDLPALGLAGWMLKPPNLVSLSNLLAQALYA